MNALVPVPVPVPETVLLTHLQPDRSLAHE